MATCEHDTQFVALDLPEEFEGLEGLIQADLQAVVGMLVNRASSGCTSPSASIASSKPSSGTA